MRLILRARLQTDRLWQTAEGLVESHRPPSGYKITQSEGPPTAVEDYWTSHTVSPFPFRSAAGSIRYLRWRSSEYPLFHELMELWGEHSAHVLLDYGCGPANDLVGYLVHGRAQHVIGMDVSATALGLAQRRLGLHAIEPGRVSLVKVSDSAPRIPLADASVDHLYCEGVLHHTSHPVGLLQEFRRILRPRGRALVMVYNHDSVFLHLYVAYKRQIVERKYAGRSVEEAFGRSTDGEDCPIATPYRPAEFASLCRDAGFAVTFRGGYFYGYEELLLLRRLGSQAAADPRLAREHRDFLLGLTMDGRGYPRTNGFFAGIGGVYELRGAGV